MRPAMVPTAVRTCFNAGMVPMLWGSPGIGKTETIKALQPDYGDMIIVHGLTHDAVDVHGFPKVIEIESGDFITKFSRPGFWPMKERGILFLDEFCSAPGLVMSAFSQLLLNKRIGEHILPKDWHIIMASNRMTDRAIVHQLPSNIANRIIHLDYEVSLDDWTEVSMAAGKRAEVIAFVRFAPDALHEFDPQGKKAKDKSTEHAFPSPRSWWFVSDLLEQNPDSRVETDLVFGAVGKPRGSEFLAFLKMYRNAPSLDAILMNPEKAAVPKDLSVLYAVAVGLSRRADVTNIRNVIKYIDRISTDLGVMAVKLATERDPAIAKTKDFMAWAVSHRDDLFVSHL